ncbi:MAG: (E)-4-hydroxy-3-methylbut-2-enyl-diphosphate synthase [Bacteroidetes bacterium]|nr:MAG: (E)-4-hydroxy-3-methylbut-2-enyl-diphosphate synthase [Bacteroidota bacterium]
MEYTSREISIGSLRLGGNQPIRLQSMTNTNTMDTEATVAQAVRMIEAGCELVRITAPGPKEAAHLEVIKKELKKRGFSVPLIADIHFNPTAAEIAARIVEKVRINPGNYIDRNAVTGINYTEAEYHDELERTALRLRPLLDICREHGTAIRIGTNHGSLSRRIVNRYGDTPEGMVQSAFEFTRICHDQGFHNLVLSMKSSNVRVMVSAYRMLAEKLREEGLNYPLHLGVTEAGDGEDGRLKSIAGIGAMLARGIGDTIRVSLTEDPEAELPVASSIVERFQQTNPDGTIIRRIRPDLCIGSELPFKKEVSETSGHLGGKNPPALLLESKGNYYQAEENGKLSVLPHAIIHISDFQNDGNTLRMLHIGESLIETNPDDIIKMLGSDVTMAVMAEAGATGLRTLAGRMRDAGLKNPLILKSPANIDNSENLLTENSLNPGNLLLDGIGDGLCLNADAVEIDQVIRIGFGLLQATRMRMTKTEFIACPSCGRTLFNIQEALQKVKARTGHLKGLKIGVMGCIVNGPGEMADADYGYVGAGNGKVTLYKSKEAVKRGIPEDEAVEALVELIKEGGDWKES